MMESTYEFSTKATCPVDGEVITFEVMLTVTGMVPVEDLLAFSHSLTAQATMQEPYTQALADQFDADVITIGTHSGVKIICSA